MRNSVSVLFWPCPDDDFLSTRRHRDVFGTNWSLWLDLFLLSVTSCLALFRWLTLDSLPVSIRRILGHVVRVCVCRAGCCEWWLGVKLLEKLPEFLLQVRVVIEEWGDLRVKTNVMSLWCQDSWCQSLWYQFMMSGYNVRVHDVRGQRSLSTLSMSSGGGTEFPCSADTTCW